MKLLTLLLNQMLVMVTLMELAERGYDQSYWFFLILLIAAPILSILTLFKGDLSEAEFGFIPLYFKRRSLQEQGQIKKLRRDLEGNKA